MSSALGGGTTLPAGSVPQQRWPPVLISAHVNRLPFASARTPVNRSAVGTVGRFIVVPSPSWPEVLPPQQRTPPVTITAQVWTMPTPTRATPVSTSADGTADVLVWPPWVPLPSSPLPLPPQQRRPPLAVTAQACVIPPSIIRAPASASIVRGIV